MPIPNPLSRSAWRAAILCAGTFAILSVFSVPLRAQWTPYATPEFEATGAYSFLRANSANAGGFDLNGASGAFTYHFKHWLAVTGDGGWYHFGGLPSSLTSSMVTYAGGPRFTFRNHAHFIPFVQVLAGGARLSATSGGVHAAETSFLIMPGVGVDVDIHHKFAIRALQVDYVGTRFPINDGTSAMQNNFRISAGIVFRFGDR